MRYVMAKMRYNADDEIFRHYMAACGYVISHKGAMSKKYSEIVNMTYNRGNDDENRTGEEVANAVASRLGVKINWGGESN